MVEEFPEAPMGHFSLGTFYLSERRYPEAVAALEKAVALEPEYAAALVALGDARAAAGNAKLAEETFQRAKKVALAQNHPGLAEEIDEKLADLR